MFTFTKSLNGSFLNGILPFHLSTFSRAVEQVEDSAPLLFTLLGAIALENGEPSSVATSTPRLFRSLELLGDPLRSQARIFHKKIKNKHICLFFVKSSKSDCLS